MKKYLFLIISSLIIITNCSNDIKINHHAVHILTYDSSNITDDVKIIPENINNIAISLTNDYKAKPVLKNYIIWYLNHINLADQYGLSGTINNYSVDKNGDENKLTDHASIIDSASSFLKLIESYIEISRNKKLIDNYKKKIKDIAYLFIELQNNNGIVNSFPNSDTSLLSENCNAVEGVESYLNICKKLNWEIDKVYSNLSYKLPKKIIANFFDPENIEFNWKIKDDKKYRIDWEKQTPDIDSQLYPLFSPVFNKYSILGSLLWKKIQVNWQGKKQDKVFLKLEKKFSNIGISKTIDTKKTELNPVLAIEKTNLSIKEKQFFHFIPYKTTLKAINLLSETKSESKIKKYIEWYLDSVNIKDINGKSGTIYQYMIPLYGKKVPLFIENKTTLSSSLFIILLSKYINITKDISILSNYEKTIKDIVYHLSYNQDEDGLLKIDHTTEKKDLIDNCFALYALKLYSKNKFFKDKLKFSLYNELIKGLKLEIKNNFFSIEENLFYLDITGAKKTLPVKSIMYPDMFYQIVPFALDLYNINNSDFFAIRYIIDSKFKIIKNKVPEDLRFILQKYSSDIKKGH